MQIEFDLTDSELVNLKIDTLDPVTQAEKVMEYLDRNYTQKKLGEKLSKTRDWVAKRVRFIRALDKLKGAERKGAEELVRDGTISMDVVVLVANLPQDQRRQIISRHPTVAEARRLLYEYRQSGSSRAKLKVLEGKLSRAYLELEGMFEQAFFNLELSRATHVRNISSSLKKRVENFIDVMWYKNQRFGFGALISQDRMMDEETLNERISWLELKENKRIEILKKAINNCHKLIIAMVEELEGKARQVPALTNKISSLQTENALLRLRLQTLEAQARKDARGVSISVGDGIPPLELNIAGNDQLKALHRVLSKTFHPDKHPEGRQHYDDLMKEINSWYDMARKNVR